MQESRLFKIVYYLLDKGQATAPELAEKFEVSVRTVYRDIDALSSAGIPVYVTTGRKGGIRLLDNYVLDKSLFSESERTEILSSLQSLLAVQYSNADMILNKLGAIFQIHLTDWIEVDFSRWGSNAQVEKKLFSDLKQSIFENRQIIFDYYSAQAMETREVQPFKLSYKDKAWYLYGFCLLRNEFRMFRLSRMKNMTLTKTNFKRTIEKGANIFSDPDDFGTLIDLELYFPLEVGFRLFDILDDSVIMQQGNGYKVNLTVPENEWLYDFLMSFGDKVTIIHPGYLRRKIINRCEAALTHHRKKDNSNSKT